MSDYKHRMSLAVPQALICAIDFEPLTAFGAMGLTIIKSELV